MSAVEHIQGRITSGVSDICPECGVAPRSIEHLFNCQSHPTQLTVLDLWDNPAAVGRRLPQPGQLTMRDELLGYHNNNNNVNPKTVPCSDSAFLVSATRAARLHENVFRVLDI